MISGFNHRCIILLCISISARTSCPLWTHSIQPPTFPKSPSVNTGVSKMDHPSSLMRSCHCQCHGFPWLGLDGKGHQTSLKQIWKGTICTNLCATAASRFSLVINSVQQRTVVKLLLTFSETNNTNSSLHRRCTSNGLILPFWVNRPGLRCKLSLFGWVVGPGFLFSGNFKIKKKHFFWGMQPGIDFRGVWY